MSVVHTARSKARQEILAAIMESARHQLAEKGAAALSLRAVARDLGLVSSALYRYVASRDKLLTLLIIDAYDAIGAVAEQAAATDDGVPHRDAGTRWLAVCRAIRGWALAHPHEFTLVYGSPVPGYQAPEATIAPASRIGAVLAEIMLAAVNAKELRAPLTPIGRPLAAPAVVAITGERPPEPYGDAVERSLVLWITLIGAINFELGGHLNQVVTDYDDYFDAAMLVVAEGVGLRLNA